MISAIVVAPEIAFGKDGAHAREIVARSLVWLVSAVVASVVCDVTIAASAELALADLADQSGCGLLEADRAAERFAAAVRAARRDRLLIIRAGYHPDIGLIDEVAAVVLRGSPDAFAVLRAAPTTLFQRLLPRLAPIVGILCPATAARRVASFEQLARLSRRGVTLQTSARPIA